MKKFVLIGFMLTLTVFAFAVKDWKIYTNTTHIRDFVTIDEKVYIATWGGLEVLNLNLGSFTEKYTTLDGLSDIDLTALAYDVNHDEILIGSYQDEVSSLKNQHFDVKLTSDMGLVSPYVRKIIYHDKYIIVTTEEGISIFQYLSGVNFPILLKSFTTLQGLTNNFIIDAVVTENNTLVVATEFGLNYGVIDELLDGEEFLHYDLTNSSLPSSNITCLGSNNDILAVGTKEGLVVIDDISNQDTWIVKENVIEGENQSVYPIFVDNSDIVYYSGGEWDYSTRMFKSFGDHSLYRFNASNPNSVTSIDLEAKKINKIKYIGSDIAVGTWGGGLFIQNEDEWDQYLSNSVSSNLITRINTDKNGLLWVTSGYRGSNPTALGTKGVSSYNGDNWVTYNMENSDIRTDNIYDIDFDSNNNVYMAGYPSGSEYGWQGAVSILTPEGYWSEIEPSDGLMHKWISDVSIDSEDNVWLSCVGDGGRVDVFSPLTDIDNPVKKLDFIIPWSTEYGNDPFTKYFYNDEIIFGGIATGTKIFNSDNISYIQNQGNWSKPEPSDLHSGFTFGVEKIHDTFGSEETWFASSAGIFVRKVFNPDTSGEYEKWYKLEKGIKRSELIEGTSNSWDAKEYYQVGEPKLFGAVPTTPSVMIKDPFDRIWIGTSSAGITMYDPETDRYSIYSTANYPMLSDNILSMGYVEETGVLYFGTDKGLMSVDIGTTVRVNTEISDIVAYPNPFYPNKGQTAVISNIKNNSELSSMPEGENICRIYDMSGQLIRELEEDKFLQFSWNGTNKKEKDCGSGVYFYVVTDSKGNSFKGKIALIR
jgi:hypothetical protein